MPVTFTLTPPNPIKAKGAKVAFVLGGGGNFVRVWCVDAPLGSKLRAQLDESEASRIVVFAGEATSSSPPWLFQPDTDGRYTLRAQEYTRGASSYGGGYSGDPAGFNSETKIGGEASRTIDFGTRVTVSLGVSPDTATLVMYVFGSDVEATTFSLHGETSPAVVDPKTPSARNAATQVLPIAAALASLPATTILGNVDTIVADMINKFSGHFGLIAGSVHAAPDNYNPPRSAFGIPVSQKFTIKSVIELMTALGYHMTTDQFRRTPFVSSGVGTGTWHNPSGSAVVADGANALIAPPPTDMAGAYLALADCYACYQGHAVNLSVHGAPDLTYSLLTAPPLLTLHASFLNFLRGRAPTAATNENPGVPVLVGGAGAKES
jgi:hypothetical protein